MRWAVLLFLLYFGAAVLAGKGRGGGGGRGRSKPGSGGWFSGGKNKKPSGEPSYPRQPAPQEVPGSWNPQSHPGPGWKAPDARPPAYNPGWNAPPPYSKNAPQYPQSGGYAPPPPYSHYPQQGHYPGGYGQGNIFGSGGFGSNRGGFGGLGGFGGYGHGGGMFGGYPKRRGFGFPGIIPIPIPIPLGGGGFGYGSYGGGFHRRSRLSDSGEVRGDPGELGSEEDSKRPRILAPMDMELEGVTELPPDMPFAKWDIVGKADGARGGDYSGEFED